jgi:hypothetical protein
MDTIRIDICYRPLRIGWAISAGEPGVEARAGGGQCTRGCQGAWCAVDRVRAVSGCQITWGRFWLALRVSPAGA